MKKTLKIIGTILIIIIVVCSCIFIYDRATINNQYKISLFYQIDFCKFGENLMKEHN